MATTNCHQIPPVIAQHLQDIANLHAISISTRLYCGKLWLLYSGLTEPAARRDDLLQPVVRRFLCFGDDERRHMFYADERVNRQIW